MYRYYLFWTQKTFITLKYVYKLRDLHVLLGASLDAGYHRNSEEWGRGGRRWGGYGGWCDDRPSSPSSQGSWLGRWSGGVIEKATSKYQSKAHVLGKPMFGLKLICDRSNPMLLSWEQKPFISYTYPSVRCWYPTNFYILYLLGWKILLLYLKLHYFYY